MSNFGKTIFQRRLEQANIDSVANRQKEVEDRSYNMRMQELALRQYNAVQEQDRSDFWKQLQMAQLMGKASAAPGARPAPKLADPRMQEGADLGLNLGQYEMEKARAANAWRVPWQESVGARDEANRTSRDFNANVTHGDRVMVEGGRNTRQEDDQVWKTWAKKGDWQHGDYRANVMASTWPDPKVRRVDNLRDDLHKEQIYKDLRTLEATGSKIISAPEDGTGDLLLITSFMTSVDPRTGVRDQEFNNAVRAAGLLEEAKVWLPRVQAGDMLSAATRQKFKRTMRLALGAHRQVYQPIYDEYRSAATRAGGDERDLLGTPHEFDAGGSPLDD